MAAADVETGSHSPASLSRLSIEELAEIQVSSVSKRPERLADAAAAIHVITREDIRRAGVTSLPEALRLAPNLQVARTTASTYAISARGFNINAANKLLVMIDGRSIYNPLNSGVFWEAQDVLLEDIERIEVISGPGGTLWGSNAVNGVINILTSSARDTHGTLVSLDAGDQEHGAAVRYGTRLGEDASLRLYAKGFHRDDTKTAAGASAADSWRGRQAGFRADWGPAHSSFTLQGDVYDRTFDLPANPENKTRSGANLLGRWDHALTGGASVQVQAYYDRVLQTVPGFFGFSEVNDTYDIHAQHLFVAGPRHEIVWGGGLRSWHNVFTSGQVIAFVPPRFDLNLADIFAQDTIALDEHLKLTWGAKVEHNNYTGTEFQPNARFAWKPNGHSLLWSAISRAVRTPSRVDRDFYVFSFPLLPLQGGPNFRSEELTAYEIGWRAQPSAAVSYSVAAFHNVYDHLRSAEPAPGGALVFDNKIKGRTDGIELSGSYQVNDRWRLSAGYNVLRERLQFKPESAQQITILGDASTQSGNDPAHQFSLRSSMNLPRGVEFDFQLRRIGALPSPAVPAYSALDARLGWHVSQSVELSIAGFNLLDGRHAEFGAAPSRSELARSVSLKLLRKL